jgi:Tfp pilus assembly protein PilV
MKRIASPGRGFSLLEAILATGIFVGAMAVLGQLVQLGLMSARSAKMATIGQLRCESKMEECVARIEAWEDATTAIPFSDDPRWQWTAQTEKTEVPNMVRLTILVEHLDQEEAPDFEVQLSRWVPAPPADGAESDDDAAKVPITIREMLGLGPPKEAGK